MCWAYLKEDLHSLVSDCVASVQRYSYTIHCAIAARVNSQCSARPNCEAQLFRVQVQLLSMSAGRKKRRLGVEDVKLQDILHTGGVSTVGLARLLKCLAKADDVPLETFRQRLLSANKDEFRKHEWKVPLQLAGDVQWTWSMLDPATSLSTMCEKSKDLQALYADAWRRAPCSPESPWRLAVAFDEFTPGNKLSLDKSRKTMVLSFNFLELGQAALSRGSSWVTIAVARSNMIKQVF